MSLAGSTAIRKGVASEAAKEIASLVEGKLGVDDGAAPLLIQQEAVGALVAPFDRAAERARRVQDRDVFGIGRGLLPNEPPTSWASTHSRSGAILSRSWANERRRPNTPWQPTCNGGVAGGALPMSAGTSPQGRRKPNGSACHRRTMAGVQDEAKHAIRAMSPFKSCEVKKPQPQR